MALSDEEAPQPRFPPLFSGHAAAADEDVFAIAVDRARQGTDAGLIVHRIQPDHLAAALVLAPETALEDAIAAVLVVAIGFADSFGALAPSEVAAQFDWPGGFRINGAACGGLRVAASTSDPAAEPDWLVIGIDLPFFARSTQEPGDFPNQTTLWNEGCGEIEPSLMLESWARHTLVWIHNWIEDGLAKVHSEWTGRAFGIGTETEIVLAGRRYCGQFMGLDEKGGMLLKSGNTTEVLPLTLALEDV